MKNNLPFSYLQGWNLLLKPVTIHELPYSSFSLS